jgi:hypothetical protein
VLSCFAVVSISQTTTKNQTATQFRSSYKSDCAQFSLIYLLPNFQSGRQSEKGMKRLITAAGLAIGLVSLFACQAITRRASNAGARPGLLAWRRFRRACILDRRTATRIALRCRSEENSLGQHPFETLKQAFIWGRVRRFHDSRYRASAFVQLRALLGNSCQPDFRMTRITECTCSLERPNPPPAQTNRPDHLSSQGHPTARSF